MSFGDGSKPLSHTWVDFFTTSVTVSDSVSQYDPSKALTINTNEKLATFFGRVYSYSTIVELDSEVGSSNDSSSQEADVKYLRIGQETDESDFLVSFEKARRVPDEGQVHSFVPIPTAFSLASVAPHQALCREKLNVDQGYLLPIEG
jgi:hypothetical protein